MGVWGGVAHGGALLFNSPVSGDHHRSIALIMGVSGGVSGLARAGLSGYFCAMEVRGDLHDESDLRTVGSEGRTFRFLVCAANTAFSSPENATVGLFGIC